MHKILMLSMNIALLILLTACAKSYDIEPILTKNGTLDITGVKLQRSKLVTDYSTNAVNTRYIGKFVHKKFLYHSGDTACQKIKYELKRALRKGYYMNYDATLWSEKRVKENKLAYCDEIKISNITFSSCKDNHKEMSYFISSSKINPHGFGFIENKTLFIDRECHDKLLKHFKNLANKDKIDIKSIRVE